MTNYVTSLIRTYVPILVGAMAAYFASRWNIVIDAEAQASAVLFIGALATGVYYAIVRWLEVKYPQIGWLLGTPKQPGYSPRGAPPPQPAPGPNDNL